jgi:ribokinase
MPDRCDVCVVGSANLDLVAGAPRIPGPGETVLGTDYSEHAGGKGLNQAVAAARSGAQVAFVGCVGNDDAGRRMLGVLTGDRIDSGAVAIGTAPTGRALIVVDAAGENSIVVVPGANHALVVPDALPPTSVVLCQLEIPLDQVRRALIAARRSGATTILNPAPAAPLPSELVALCDVIVPNEHEVELLGGAEALIEQGCGAVVVTLGSAGVAVHTADGVSHTDSFDVDVVDTTGAGDAFCGSLAAQLAAGESLASAVRWASAAGGLATTVLGAVPAQPTADSIRELLASQPVAS